MNTEEQCVEIMKKIHDIVNTTGEQVTFTKDGGGNSLTVYIGLLHTHVGDRDIFSFEDMISQLHSVLHGGPGLSWAQDRKE